MVDSELTGPGVLIRTIKEGDNVTFAEKGDVCRLHYELYLEDGMKLIETTYRHKRPFQFIVGIGQVIQGWDIIIPYLSLYSINEITIPYCYAYGDIGLPPKIPPKSVLIYKLEITYIDKQQQSRKAKR